MTRTTGPGPGIPVTVPQPPGPEPEPQPDPQPPDTQPSPDPQVPPDPRPPEPELKLRLFMPSWTAAPAPGSLAPVERDHSCVETHRALPGNWACESRFRIQVPQRC